MRAIRASRLPAQIWQTFMSPVPASPARTFRATRPGGKTSNYERPKTSVYVGKGLPAASRLDRLMNFFTEFFATV